MKLMENSQDYSRQNPQNDTEETATLSDTRKPLLTLRMLNRLKKMRINKRKEMDDKRKLLGVMYAPPKEEG